MTEHWGCRMTIRPRRSLLYMPGSNARALEKAKTLAVDGVILDLEDAVAPDAKAAARDQVAAAVKAGGFGAREVFIRTNGFDTPWFSDDLTAAARAAPDAILIPKISTPRAARTDRAAPAEHAHRSQGAHLGDDRDAGRDLQCAPDRVRGDRRRNPPHRLRARHQRSRQGDAREDLARPRPDAAVARDLPARRARIRHRYSRRRVQRHRQHAGLRRGMRAGARHGLRRQDADPSEPDRAVQRGVLADGATRSRRRAR